MLIGRKSREACHRCGLSAIRIVGAANDRSRRDFREALNAAAATDARGHTWPERQSVINVAADAFFHADLRVCSSDDPDRGDGMRRVRSA
jgi:hypothetical protein